MAITQHSDDIKEVNKKDFLLQSIYSCKVERNMKVDVVMELKCNRKVKHSKIPQRYVLVIDVSGSMASPIVAEDTRSLLERMKVYAKLIIRESPKQNWLSIVVFSDYAEIMLPMTQMTDKGKAEASKIVNNLKTLGGTNLSSGLFQGLKAVEDASTGQQTRDCIVFFTDGVINEGISEADKLVEKFKKKVKCLQDKSGRKHHIQLVTITIGDNQPIFLVEVAKLLSSDSFYWLNCDSEIEANMLIPIFLREDGCVCDVNVTLTCATGITFIKESLSPLNQMVQVEQQQSDKLEFIVGYIPHDAKRHVQFSLDISRRQPDNDVLFEAKKEYFDQNLVKRTHTGTVKLSTLTMAEARKKVSRLPAPKPEAYSYFKDHSSYLVEEDIIDDSWDKAQLAYMNNTVQKCRHATIAAFDEADNTYDQQVKYKKSLDAINNELSFAKSLFGDENSFFIQSEKKTSAFSNILKDQVQHPEKASCWPRNAAIVSSLNKEMPTASGVFSTSKQVYMTSRIYKQLQKYIQIVRESVKYSGSHERAEKHKDEVDKAIGKMKSPYKTPVLNAEHRPANKRKDLLKSVKQSQLSTA